MRRAARSSSFHLSRPSRDPTWLASAFNVLSAQLRCSLLRSPPRSSSCPSSVVSLSADASLVSAAAAPPRRVRLRVGAAFASVTVTAPPAAFFAAFAPRAPAGSPPSFSSPSASAASGEPFAENACSPLFARRAADPGVGAGVRPVFPAFPMGRCGVTSPASSAVAAAAACARAVALSVAFLFLVVRTTVVGSLACSSPSLFAPAPGGGDDAFSERVFVVVVASVSLSPNAFLNSPSVMVLTFFGSFAMCAATAFSMDVAASSAIASIDAMRSSSSP